MKSNRDDQARMIFRRLEKDKFREFLLVGIIGLLLVSILAIRTDKMNYDHALFNKNWDHHKYIAMAAGNPLDFHIAPFCWRIGTPVLAKALPLDLQSSFFVISFTSIWMTGVMIYYVARAFDFTKIYAFIGMLMFFSLEWGAKFTLLVFWGVDPLSFLFITLAMYSILTKKEIFFLVVLTVGVTVKESVIFVAPLYYTFNARKFIDLELAKRMLLLIIPACIVLISVRLGIPKMNDDLTYLNTLSEKLYIVQEGTASYDYWELFRNVGLQRFKDLSLSTLGTYSVCPFGFVIMALPFFSAKKNTRLFFKFAPFLALVYSQLLFAVNTPRLLVLGFPAIIIMALNGVFAVSETLFVNPRYFLILTMLLFGLDLISFNPFLSDPSHNLLMEAVIFTLFLGLGFSFRVES